MMLQKVKIILYKVNPQNWFPHWL